MTRSLAPVALCLLLAFVGCKAGTRNLRSDDDPGAREALARIAELERARSMGGGELVAFTASGAPTVRARALWALGRIQNPATIPAIVTALQDPVPTVRAEAAFAAGLLAQSWDPLEDEAKLALSDALLDAEEPEADRPAKLRMLEALGKVGTDVAVERLRTRLDTAEADVQARAALSLGVFGRRQGKLDDRTVVAALGLLDPGKPQRVRYAGAYVLAFSRQPPARPALVQCLSDADAEVRSLCARGLAEVAEQGDVPPLRAALTDADRRVVVEATRALARAVERCPKESCAALDALGDLTGKIDSVARGEARGVHPLLALAQQGLPARGRELLTRLHGAIGVGAQQKPEDTDLAWLECRFAAALDRLDGNTARVARCGGTLVPQGRRLAMGLREVTRGLGSAPVPEAVWTLWLAHLDSDVPTLRTAAMEALATAKVKQAIPRIRPLIQSEDAIVAVNAALAAAALGDREAYPLVRRLASQVGANLDFIPAGDALVELARPVDPADAADEQQQKERAKDAETVLRTWLTLPQAPIRHAAAAALSKLTGQTVRAPFVEGPAPRDFPPVPAGATLTFETTKGRFVVRLDTVETPYTSANLHALAARGYFDGGVFHRVVPDFVAQGGDPRGDGEGGPGYAIPCEIAHAPYLRASFGMALSGKDTGGSQFFITHAAQPHLDGRYTRFGEVTDGMDVVDRLIEGDVIHKVIAGP